MLRLCLGEGSSLSSQQFDGKWFGHVSVFLGVLKASFVHRHESVELQILDRA
jgi:hypothetical protein